MRRNLQNSEPEVAEVARQTTPCARRRRGHETPINSSLSAVLGSIPSSLTCSSASPAASPNVAAEVTRQFVFRASFLLHPSTFPQDAPAQNGVRVSSHPFA